LLRTGKGRGGGIGGKLTTVAYVRKTTTTEKTLGDWRRANIERNSFVQEKVFQKLDLGRFQVTRRNGGGDLKRREGPSFKGKNRARKKNLTMKKGTFTIFLHKRKQNERVVPGIESKICGKHVYLSGDAKTTREAGKIRGNVSTGGGEVTAQSPTWGFRFAYGRSPWGKQLQTNNMGPLE